MANGLSSEDRGWGRVTITMLIVPHTTTEPLPLLARYSKHVASFPAAQLSSFRAQDVFIDGVNTQV